MKVPGVDPANGKKRSCKNSTQSIIVHLKMSAMNSFCRSASAVILVVTLATTGIQAQFAPSRFEIGLNAGTLVYQGDLSENILGYTRELKPAIGIFASRSFDDFFSLRGNLVFGSIGADESTYSNPAWRKFRAFRFSSPISEFSTSLVWDLFGKTYRTGFRRLSPYFFAGAGFTVLSVNRDWSRFNKTFFDSKSSASIGLGIDTLHKTPGILPVFPVGAGLRYLISNHFYVNVEAAYRITTSDYIDGFKYAGDPNRNDHYYGLSAGLSYRFGTDKLNCPKPVL
jgi:hypothetical protein